LDWKEVTRECIGGAAVLGKILLVVVFFGILFGA
jgi:hypothetical protein